MSDEAVYDPNDPNDPLRHKYLERAKRSTFAIPLRRKVAAGLGVAEDAFDGIHVERVPRTFRARAKRLLDR